MSSFPKKVNYCPRQETYPLKSSLSEAIFQYKKQKSQLPGGRGEKVKGSPKSGSQDGSSFGEHERTKLHNNPCSSCWDVSVWTKVVEQPSGIAILIKKKRKIPSCLGSFYFLNISHGLVTFVVAYPVLIYTDYETDFMDRIWGALNTTGNASKLSNLALLL